MKITAKTVKCAKCANCINNRLRLTMDVPGGWRFGCEMCYADRIGARAELLFEKAWALRSMADVVMDRYSRTFTGKEAIDAGVAEFASRRLAAVERLGRMAGEILDMTDAASVRAARERYVAEYFGRAKEGAQ